MSGEEQTKSLRGTTQQVKQAMSQVTLDRFQTPNTGVNIDDGNDESNTSSSVKRNFHELSPEVGISPDHKVSRSDVGGDMPERTT
jgi:hypothetical protein